MTRAKPERPSDAGEAAWGERATQPTAADIATAARAAAAGIRCIRPTLLPDEASWVFPARVTLDDPSAAGVPPGPGQ
ncbi:hypothetical protein GCM10010219_16670 [Streptomyces netropsis]|nr:hypothetical protein GCM10010219_16670 [Streptomyces netropsis]